MFYDMGAISTTATIVGKHAIPRYRILVCVLTYMCICIYISYVCMYVNTYHTYCMCACIHTWHEYYVLMYVIVMKL